MPPTSLIWPGQDMTTPWAVPPKCDGTCFTHLNGVCPCPRRGKMREGLVRAPERVPEVLSLHRHRDTVEGRELVGRTIDHAFGARAVVTADVDDQGIVKLSEVFDRLDNSTDLVV